MTTLVHFFLINKNEHSAVISLINYICKLPYRQIFTWKLIKTKLIIRDLHYGCYKSEFCNNTINHIYCIISNFIDQMRWLKEIVTNLNSFQTIYHINKVILSKNNIFSNKTYKHSHTHKLHNSKYSLNSNSPVRILLKFLIYGHYNCLSIINTILSIINKSWLRA